MRKKRTNTPTKEKRRKTPKGKIFFIFEWPQGEKEKIKGKNKKGKWKEARGKIKSGKGEFQNFREWPANGKKVQRKNKNAKIKSPEEKRKREKWEMDIRPNFWFSWPKILRFYILYFYFCRTQHFFRTLKSALPKIKKKKIWK